MPGFVPPQLASLRSKPPAGDNWLREIKYDGYRLQTGERWWLAELYRLTGLVKLTQGEPDMEGAETAFLRALETARQQDARLHELRAATELAKLGDRNATSRDRRMLLEPILDVIEGGEERRDVRDARALLLDLV